MGKVACAGAVEDLVVDAELVEEIGQDDASHGVDGIHAHTELTLADGLAVNELQSEY